MQQGDYSSSAPYYQFPHLQNPNPNPSDHPLPNPHASAPPFTPNYAPSDYTQYATATAYPPYSDPVPPSSAPTAPSFDPLFDSHPSYQQPPLPNQPYYQPCDQHQSPPSYAPPTSSSITPNPIPNSSYSSLYSSVPSVPTYEGPYDNPVKADHFGAYFDDYGGINRSRSDLGSDFYGKGVGVSRYEPGRDDGYGDGVYAYEGGNVEPYGASRTAPKSSTWSSFDDYGRSISFPSERESSAASKIVKAVPKANAHEDVKGAVQKFRVKMLAESGGQNTMDVLCQIGLDGIHMLDPNTSRTLRIYPLENVTGCDRLDSSTFAFWSKSPVDIEPRRIRLQSNSYTTTTLLDTVIAATIQFKEMRESSRRAAEPVKTNETTTEKKKGFGDLMNLIKPPNEEKDHWVPDEAVSKCTACSTDFGAFVRKHHCRNCGDIFCDKCTQGRIALTDDENAQPVRVCDQCMAEVTQRLSSAKEALSKPVMKIHEDLAQKLQEELERNRRRSGSLTEGSGKRMREVECPICTVHLQVQVPSSGSETIECGVCQHPFLVSAH